MKKLTIKNGFARSVLWCALGFAAPAALDVASTSANLGVSFAQASAQAKTKETRRLPGISERMLKQLGEVQEMIAPTVEEGQPEKEPDLQGALKQLQKMERDCRDKCNSVELSSIYRFYGYAYVTMERYNEAISYYKKLVDLSPGVTIAVELESLFILAQLSYQDEKYDDALKFLNKWMGLSTIVGSDKIFLRASICYAKGDMACALKDASQAIKMEEDKGKVAPEQWLNLQAALLLEKENYKSAVGVMEKLVRNYSRADYWTRLAGIYGLLNRPKDQMHALDAMYAVDGLAKSGEYVNLAFLYIENEVPYKAAVVLEKGLKKKVVEQTVKNMKILAAAYISAKEPEEAIRVLNDTAPVAAREDSNNKSKKGYAPEQGNIFNQLSGLYLDIEKPKESVEAGKKAIRLGTKNVGDVYVNMGIAYVEMEQYKNAVEAFTEAKKDKRVARFATNWLKHAEREYDRQQQLARAMEKVKS